MLKRLLLGTTIIVLSLAYFQPSASAASQYVPVTICHYNATDGTYTAESLLFTTSDAALRLTDATGYSHINDTNTDLWAAFNWAGQYSSVNVPNSHALLHQVTTTTYVNTRYFHGYVTTTSWVPDPAKVAILNNGCI